MEIQELKELIRFFEESNCRKLKLKQGDFQIKLVKDNSQKKEKVIETHTDNQIIKNDECIVKAPLVGIYYDSPDPNSDTYVKKGDRVKKGQVLCLIEAMKMMNEVVSPKDGYINNIFLNNQDIVEYEAPLFSIGD